MREDEELRVELLLVSKESAELHLIRTPEGLYILTIPREELDDAVEETAGYRTPNNTSDVE